MSYEKYFKNWVSEKAANNPEFKDSLSGLYSLAGRVDNHALYTFGKIVENAISHAHHAQDRHYDIRPVVYSNGVIRLIDYNSGQEVSFFRHHNGFWGWKGPHKLVELHGGRGLGSTFWQNLADNSFFHNVPYASKN